MKVLIALATALIALPSLAHAGEGYVTCQAYSPAKNKVWYTMAFPAAKTDTDTLYTRFVAHLAANGYTKGTYDTEPATVEGICNWESSADAANKKTANYKASYQSKGANTLGIGDFPGN